MIVVKSEREECVAARVVDGGARETRGAAFDHLRGFVIGAKRAGRWWRLQGGLVALVTRGPSSWMDWEAFPGPCSPVISA